MYIDSTKINQWFGISVLSLVFISALIAPVLTGYHPDEQPAPAENRYRPPSFSHWFGTDQFGRDVYTRVLYGGRVSLSISLLVVFCAGMFGSIYGALSGYWGGILDMIMMRLVDILLSFPVVFLAVTCLALIGNSLLLLILVLSITSWMDIARLVRGDVLTIKQRPYMLRARASGFSNRRIILRHILPNVFSTLRPVVLIRAAEIMLIESALSFVGLGVQPPTASWGSVIADGRVVLSTAWWICAFPGLVIILTSVGFYNVAEAMRASKA